MLGVLRRSADRLGSKFGRILNGEQRRFLNVHEYQVRSCALNGVRVERVPEVDYSPFCRSIGSEP